MSLVHPRRSVLLAALLAALLPASAFAARPFVTDDAGVIDTRQCEWETVGARTTFATGEPAAEAVASQIACGVGATTQLGLGITAARAGDEREHALALAGKSQLVRHERGAAAIAYGANLLRETDASYRLDTAAVTLIGTLPLGGVTAHANLGWLRSKRDRLDSTTWGLALEYPLHDGVDVGVETYGDDRSRPLVGLGARWTPAGGFSANVAYAAQAGGARARVVSAGIKISF